MREVAGALVYADDGADLERRDVHENVVAVNHTPFVTSWRGAQVILVVVGHSITAIPVFVLDGCASPPFLVFDISVVIMTVLVLVVVMTVLILGNGDTAHETCGKDRER